MAFYTFRWSTSDADGASVVVRNAAGDAVATGSIDDTTSITNEAYVTFTADLPTTDTYTATATVRGRSRTTPGVLDHLSPAALAATYATKADAVTDADVAAEVTTQLAADTTVKQAAATAADGAVDATLAAGPIITPPRTTFFTKKSNLFDKATVTADMRYASGSGTPTANTGTSISDWIAVKPNTAYTLNYTVRITYFDINRAYVGNTTLPTTNATAQPITTPAGAAYARMTVNNIAVPNAQLNEGAALLPYEVGTPKVSSLFLRSLDQQLATTPIGPRRTTFFTEPSNLFDPEAATAGQSLPSGSGTPAATNHTLSGWIPVSSGTTYTFAYVVRITYFDEQQAYLGYLTSPTTDATPQTVTTPAGTAYVRLTVNNNGVDTAQINAGSTLLAYESGTPVVRDAYLGITESLPPVLDADMSGVFDANVTYPDLSATIVGSQPADVHALYDALVTAHPNYVTRTLIGNEASESLPIYKYEFKPTLPSATIGSPTPLAKVILVTGTHGSEKASIWSGYHLMENLCNGWEADPLLAALRFNCHIIVVPVANPSGVRDNVRKNANGVDLARNWPTDWAQGAPADQTYGGTAPMSEPETQAMDTVLVEHSDALLVADFHNFFDPPDAYQFIWNVPANDRNGHIGLAHIRRMDRKWKVDAPAVVNQSPDVFIGYSGTAPVGSLGREAVARGFASGATFEHCNKVPGDPTSTEYDSRAMTWGYEAVTNYLLMQVDNLVPRQS